MMYYQQHKKTQYQRWRAQLFIFVVLCDCALINAFHNSLPIFSQSSRSITTRTWSVALNAKSPLGNGKKTSSTRRRRQATPPLRLFKQLEREKEAEVIKSTKTNNDSTKFMDIFTGNSESDNMMSAADQAWSTMEDSSEDVDDQFLKTEAIILISAVAIVGGIISQNPTALDFTETFVSDPPTALQNLVDSVESMGNAGYLYFAFFYTIAELLAIPATPLTASAGYLFGVTKGTGIVLLSASIAASISFLVGRTFLRTTVEKLLDNYPEFKKLDKAIGKEGFKIMLLLRLSPLFPFALSNYLYGVTSVEFWPYFFGTLIGFTPGTIAYVYTGEVGKMLTLDDGGSAQPWYIYAGGLVLLTAVLKVLADVATGIINDLDEESDGM